MPDNNYYNKLANQIKNGTLKVLKPDDTFKFSCNCCGICCTDRNDILLTPYDVFRIAKHLHIQTEDVLEKYCDTFLGGSSKLPMVSVKFTEFKFHGIRHLVCPFLVDEGKNHDKYICAIHPVKPFICAVYPLGRITKSNKDGTAEIIYIQQDVTCSNNEPKTYTLKEWLDMFKVEESEKVSKEFSNFLVNIMQKLDFQKLEQNKIITQKTKDMIYNAYLNALYCGLDLDKDVFEVLGERFKDFTKFVDWFAESSNSFGIEI